MISTHTPLAGRDKSLNVIAYAVKFQLTRPLRGVTRHKQSGSAGHLISTHTPRKGRDEKLCLAVGFCYQFQLTRPARGVTSSPFVRLLVQ